MPGLWTRVKVWSSGEILTAADLNAEFNNVITNSVPAQIDDYSVNQAQTELQTDPFPASVLSLATSLAGEFERLRYQIARITGNSFWYQAPPTDLSTLSQGESLGLHIGLEFEGALGGASSTANVLAKLINQGAIINAASLSTADTVVADFDSTNKKFNAFSYILAAGNILAFPGHHGNPVKGSISAWFRNFAANDYIAYNPLLGLELYLSATGLLTWKVTEKTAATESTKNTTTVQGVTSRAGDTTFRNVTAKWRFNDEAGTSTDLMEMEREAADEGTQISGDNIDISSCDGGIWFFGARRNEPASWDHFLANNGLPTAHSSPWTSNGTPNATVSNGILNIATTGGTTGYFSKTGSPLTGVNTSSMTAVIKLRVNSISQRASLDNPQCFFYVRDDSEDRSFALQFFKGSVALFFYGASPVLIYEEFLDTSQFHTYWITSSGTPNPTVKLYIDGLLVFSEVNSVSDATASDFVQFGDAIATGDIDIDEEFVAFADEVAAPIAASSQGNLDSIGLTSNVISDSVITRLQSSKVTDVFGKVPSYGPTLPHTCVFDRFGIAITFSSTNYTNLQGRFKYYIPGDGISEYECSSQFTGDNGALNEQTYAAIGVNDDFDGLTANTVNFPSYGGGIVTSLVAGRRHHVSCSRKVILPVGLNKLSLFVAVSADTTTLADPSAIIFERSIAKVSMLP